MHGLVWRNVESLMRLFCFLIATSLAAAVPVFELGSLPPLLAGPDSQLRAGALVQISGTVSEFVEHQGSVVIALFDKETSSAAGCTVNGKMLRDLPQMSAGRRYTVEGTLLRWESQSTGMAILLDRCRVLPELIELKPQTVYLGVVRTGDREVGFQMRIEEGGEGPFHARLTPIDSGKFFEDWENRLGLDAKLRLARGPSEWTGNYSRATKSMRLTRDGQHLDFVLQSPASFAGVLIVRKGLETTVRMMAANSSGHLFGYAAQPNPQERRPPVAAVQPAAPRRRPAVEIPLVIAEESAKQWFEKREEFRNRSASIPKKIAGGWELFYTVYQPVNPRESHLLLTLHVLRLSDGTIDVQQVKTAVE